MRFPLLPFFPLLLAVPCWGEGEPSAEPTGLDAVTARSWVIARADTGEILAGREIDAPRKSASITKSMTAHIIATLAANDPTILDQIVIFSEVAMRPTGSLTGLELGESLTVRDALYGLMLPSGNDAGNALAEHFNHLFDPPGDDVVVTPAREPYANFVAEMNRRAATLGMTTTIYRIPFGDGGGADDHTTSAGDLMLLARAAMADPLFRQIVSTAEHTATVTTPDGATRSVTWTNTNRFLGEPGFHGIKTGTTRLAGACLLTAFHHEDHNVFIAVLGSETSDQRYVDTRLILREVLGVETNGGDQEADK